jgi:hypothetical protein
VRLGQTFDKLSTCMNESTSGQEENNTDVLPSESNTHGQYRSLKMLVIIEEMAADDFSF